MKKFKDLSLKGQKMRIVKDAITQIKLKRFGVTQGTYLRLLEIDDEGSYYYPKSDESIQKLLETNKCECCAKGAIFASCVLTINKVKGNDDFGEEGFMKSKLKKWFSKLELDMIEAAFEKQVIYDSAGKLSNGVYDLNTSELIPTELGIKCIKFGKRYGSAKKRLLKILENVLKNKEFKP